MKVLVTNVAALRARYGAKGLAKVNAAVKSLAQADKARHLTTRLIDISDSAAMKKLKGSAVSNVSSERQAKDAVDAICAALTPDYIVLLGGPDIVPHLNLNNPTPDDKDGPVPSDLPYASDAPFTSRDAAKYAAVTRVVGRMAGVTAASSPDLLVQAINAAAAFKTQKRAVYEPHFAISAHVWEASTKESMNNVFGSEAIELCPPTGTPGIRKKIAPLSHFINCHGAPVDSQFYGQRSDDFPVALTSRDVAAEARRNTVVAAECCFGAQLYDPRLANDEMPMSNAYFKAGAVAFLGSTTTAYGPASGNGSADLITQYFFADVLSGASVGRAFLQARQKFVLGEKMEDPVNLKTLAQFILIADPALTPCESSSPLAKAAAKVVDQRAARETRRTALVAAGKNAADSSGFPGKEVTRVPAKVANLVQRLARERGMGRRQLSAFEVVGAGNYGRELKARKVEQKVFMVVEHRPSGRKRSKKNEANIPHTHILVAHTQDNRVVEVAEYVRR
jgi:hypothetical protein